MGATLSLPTGRSRDKVEWYSKLALVPESKIIDINQGQFEREDADQLYFVSASIPTQLHIRATIFGQIIETLPNSNMPASRIILDSDGNLPKEIETDLVDWYCRCVDFIESNLQIHGLNAETRYGRQDLSLKFQPLQGKDLELFDILWAGSALCMSILVRRQLKMNIDERIVEWSSRLLLERSRKLDSNTIALTLGPLLQHLVYSDYDFDRNLFFTTMRGTNLACWAPRSAQPGDSLCDITGATYPFVLRSRPAGTFEILGDAYVHGAELSHILDIPDEQWKPIAVRKSRLFQEHVTFEVFDDLRIQAGKSRRARHINQDVQELGAEQTAMSKGFPKRWLACSKLNTTSTPSRNIQTSQDHTRHVP